MIGGDSISNQSGGVDIDGQFVNIGGDVVGRDKIVANYGYTVEQVNGLLAQIASTFQPKAFDGRCPYLGLDAFTEDDADRFFGRERLVADLLERVKASRFVLIAGPSGSGKSSLARAGALHALKQGGLSGLHSERWLYSALTPGRNPIEALASAVSQLKSPEIGDYLRQHATDAEALHKCAESALSDRRDQRAVIFVDQFEEVFTQIAREEECTAFLNLLTRAATIENGRVTVLLTMRSDFVSNCATYPALSELINQPSQFMLVGAMQPAELVSAIAQPALRVGLKIDPDLIAQIVNDMGDEPGSLPLMQFALKDLFDVQKAKGGVIALMLNDYLARGGLHKALERHAEESFRQLTEAEQQLARTIFSGLIGPSRGTADTRRTATLEELVPANVDRASVEAVVRKLANARLLTTDEHDHHIAVALAHEALIDAWPWLHRLIHDNRDAIALQNQIADDAQEWTHNDRNSSYLYTGVRLADVREKLAAKQITLGYLTQTFIQVSQAQQQRRQVGVAAGVIATIGALVLAVIIFSTQSNENANLAAQNARIAGTAQTASTIAVEQRNEAQRQAATAHAETNARATAQAEAVIQQDKAENQQKLSRSRELAAIAVSQLEKDAERALLLAIEANKTAHTVQAEDVLRKALIASHARVRLPAYPRAKSIAWNPTGRSLAIVSGPNSVSIWDIDQLKIISRINVSSTVINSIAWSPNGRYLSVGSEDGTLQLWNTVTNQIEDSITGFNDSVDSLGWDLDSTRLIIGGCASGQKKDYNCSISEVSIWNIFHDRRPLSIESISCKDTPFGCRVRGVAWSPSGKYIAAGVNNGDVIIWNATDYKRISKLDMDSWGIYDIAWSPDGKELASIGFKLVRILNVETGNVETTISANLSSSLSNDSAKIDWSPDGKRLAFNDQDSTIRILTLKTEEVDLLTGYTGDINGLSWSPNGLQLASLSSDGYVILWDTTSGASEIVYGPGLGYSINSLCWNPDGTKLVFGNYNLQLWDAVSNKWSNIATTYPNYAVAWDPMGTHIAIDSNKTQIKVIDAGTGQELMTLAGHTEPVRSIDWNSTGTLLASASEDDTVRVWDLKSGTQQLLIRVPDASSTNNSPAVVDWSPNDRYLAFALQSTNMWIWDLQENKGTKINLKVQNTISDLEWSPDGTMIATAAATVDAWNASTGQKQFALSISGNGVTSGAYSVTWSPDGRRLATGERNGTVRLWDVSTQMNIAMLIGQNETTKKLAWSPDGRRLASGSDDFTVWIYYTNVDDLINVASKQISFEIWPDGSSTQRQLTLEERNRYMGEALPSALPTP